MKKEVIAHKDPKSPISEIFRTLRTNIQFMGTGKGLKTLLITSTTPSEGKSWVSANLAVAFAQAGKRVILIDADMRKGRQFAIFSVPPTPGLSNFLSGINEKGKEDDSDILNYVRETEVENLFVVTSGNVPPNPSELLVSSKMPEMIDRLKTLCDIVIFDGTPSALVTDAIILSRFVDTSIIVTAYKQTKMDALEKIKKSIENVGGKIGGVVINKTPISARKYEETYYYGRTKNSKPSKNIESTSIKKNSIRKVLSEDLKALTQKEKLEEIEKKSDEIYKTIEKNDINALREKIPVYDKVEMNTDKSDSNISIKKTEDILKQINQYLSDEKTKINTKGDNE